MEELNIKELKENPKTFYLASELEKIIKNIEETSYIKTGKKYGVSDNTIRKWIKQYRSNSVGEL